MIRTLVASSYDQDLTYSLVAAGGVPGADQSLWPRLLSWAPQESILRQTEETIDGDRVIENIDSRVVNIMAKWRSMQGLDKLTRSKDAHAKSAKQINAATAVVVLLVSCPGAMEVHRCYDRSRATLANKDVVRLN